MTSGAVGNGGRLNINADSLTLTDGASLTTGVIGALDALPSGRGNGGNINIQVNSLSLNNGAQLISSTSGQGNAVNVNLDVLDKVTITGVNNGLPSAIFSFVGTGAIGNGGNINVKAGSFELSNS